MPLWMRFNWREIQYSDVKFYKNYGIKQAIPYAWLASSPTFHSHDLLSRILWMHKYDDEFDKGFDFLGDVMMILAERLQGCFYELYIENMETQVADLVCVLIEDYLPSKNFPTNYTMDEIDVLLYDLCHCIVELDSSELEKYHYVSPCVLSGLLNCYRDVFGDEQFEGFFNPEEFPDLCNQNLTGVNFSNLDLSNIDLSGANLTDADLSNADLSGADLTDANLEGIITDENTIIEIPEE